MPPGEQPQFEDPFWNAGTGPQRLLRSVRPSAHGRRIGIKRPSYLCLPELPARFSAVCPDSQIVIVLRDPAKRAVSAYYHYMRMGHLPIIDLELGMRLLVQGELAQRYPRSEEVLAFGLYGKALRRWAAFFPPEQIHIMKHEWIATHPREAMASLYTHLGLRPVAIKPRTLNARPMSGAYSHARLHALAIMRPYTLRTIDNFGHAVPIRGVRSYALRGLDKYVIARLLPRPMPPVSIPTLRLLSEYYADDCLQLDSALRDCASMCENYTTVGVKSPRDVRPI